jgi:hypothetical protein
MSPPIRWLLCSEWVSSNVASVLYSVRGHSNEYVATNLKLRDVTASLMAQAATHRDVVKGKACSQE